MAESPRPDADWLSFMMQPVRYVDAARFAACFDGAVAPALSQRMRSNTRLQDRLSALIQTRYKLDGWIDPHTLDAADRTVALAGPAELAALALRAGSIYWSASIAGTVLAKAVNALQQQLGDSLVGFAIGQRDLAGPIQSLDPLDSVGGRIGADGWRCLAAWCDAAPVGIGARVRLKLPQDSIADQPCPAQFKDNGAAIIRRAAA
jgi:YOP proteins translocation protein K (YscK)